MPSLARPACRNWLALWLGTIVRMSSKSGRHCREKVNNKGQQGSKPLERKRFFFFVPLCVRDYFHDQLAFS
jgi:hypothetical protein